MQRSGEAFLKMVLQRASPVPIFTNVVITTLPIVVDEVTTTMEMMPAIRAYSIAVAPVSLLQNPVRLLQNFCAVLNILPLPGLQKLAPAFKLTLTPQVLTPRLRGSSNLLHLQN